MGFALSFKENDLGHFFEIDTGLIGPSALGKEVQNNFHDLIHTKKAQGWKNGLHDEATLQLSYQKRFKKFKNKTSDFFPYYGVGLGQIQIGVHAGAVIRYGIHLPDDFGPSRPSASDGDSFISPLTSQKNNLTSYYLFAGARISAVARNIFLDGNSFQQSPHVTKYPMTSESELGLGISKIPLAFVWRFVTRSPEFKERSRYVHFASMNFVYSF